MRKSASASASTSNTLPIYHPRQFCARSASNLTRSSDIPELLNRGIELGQVEALAQHVHLRLQSTGGRAVTHARHGRAARLEQQVRACHVAEAARTDSDREAFGLCSETLLKRRSTRSNAE